jgi:hypothetical protein
MRFEWRVLIGVTVLSVAAVLPRPAAAQIPPQSGCADCHFADPRSPRRDHLEAWDRSPHARAGIGCEKCHGGNPRTFEGLPAHSSIIDPSDSKSPVNRRNLPATCGTCHAGALAAFQGSRHYELLRSGNRSGPTCSTCHGEVEGRTLSPKALASECNDCHGPGERAPRAERAREVREQYEALTAVRQDMKLAQSLIKRVDDSQRRASLTESYQQAEVPLQRAIDAGHQFMYADLREYLAVARTRVGVLLSTLANR